MYSSWKRKVSLFISCPLLADVAYPLHEIRGLSNKKCSLVDWKKTEKCSRILIMPDDARTHAGLHIGEHGTWLLLLLRQTMMRCLLKSCKRRCRVSESEWAANISSHTDRFMSSVRRLLVYIRLNTVSALMLYVCKVEHRSFVSASYFTIVPAVRSRTHRAVSKRPCQKLAHQICATELVLCFYSLTPTAFHQSGHTPCLWRP
jgi:hypothetical protein